MPKKLLVYAAAFAEEFADAKGFGWAWSANGSSEATAEVAAATATAAAAAPVHDWPSLMKLKVWLGCAWVGVVWASG